MTSKFYTRICINLNSRCVSMTIFEGSGRSIEEKVYCGTEVVELIGITRIMVNGHIVDKLFCANLEMEKPKIEQRSMVIKVG